MVDLASKNVDSTVLGCFDAVYMVLRLAIEAGLVISMQGIARAVCWWLIKRPSNTAGASNFVEKVKSI
jgi:hypothetical protein